MGWLNRLRSGSLDARYEKRCAKAHREGLHAVQDEAWQLISDCIGKFTTHKHAALVAFSTVKMSLPIETGAGNWHRVIALGWVQSTAVTVLDLQSDFNPQLMGAVARDLVKQAEVFHYAAHRVNASVMGAVLAETLTSLRLGERMLSRSISASGQREELPHVAVSMWRRLADMQAGKNDLPAFTGDVDDLSAWFDQCLRESFRETGEQEADSGFVRAWGVNVLMEAIHVSGRSVLYVSGGVDPGVATLVDVSVLDDPARPVTTSVDLHGVSLPVIGEKAVSLFTATAGRRTGELSGAAFDDHVVDLLNWVGGTIWGPVLATWPHLADQPFTVVPLGECGMLPLYTALVDGRPLCTSVDLTIAPSGRSLVLAAESPPASGEVFVAADPSSGDDELRYVVDEAAAVAEVRHTKPVVVGRQGLEETDLVVRIRDSAVVHLACHGVISPVEPLRSSIVLGRPITAGTVLDEDLRRGSLIVLSACDLAGIGTYAPGEQLGFPAVLLAAGARSVVAALWPVPDTRRTVRLMTRFHQEARTSTTTKALAAAIGHAHDSGAAATLWAPFACFGA